MCQPADTVQFERKLAPSGDVEPVGQGAISTVAITVELPILLAEPTAPPPGQYELFVHGTGVSTAGSTM